MLNPNLGETRRRGVTELVTVEAFLEGLRRSGLMTADEVDAFMVTLPPLLGQPTVKSLASELVRRGKLTKYQAVRIAAGHPEGLVLGKYVIQDKIGEGGMGQVFIAEHRRMKRPVVVKILPPQAMQSEYTVRRFQREVEAAAQLHHPNIVTAYDADEENGIHFLVMEYVDGVPLGEYVTRHGPMPVAKAVTCILQAARGLAYAHSKGIVHRDIKPNNLLMDSAGVVKVLDMGLARFDDGRKTMPDSDSKSLTRENQIVGTVEYMAPEQVDDSSSADRRSDIYSLGCTLFRLLIGRPPFLGDTLVQTLLAHRTESVPSVCELRQDVPLHMDSILRKMLAKKASDRYQSMHEVVTVLEALLADLGGETPHEAIVSNEETQQLDLSEFSLSDVVRPQGPGSSVAATVDTRTTDKTQTSAPSASHGSLTTKALDVPAIGIDLGTTFSAIAFLDPTGRPQLAENLEGDKITPSVVLFDEQEVVVGREAVKAMSSDWDRIAECMKRDMGHREYRRAINGKRFPPEVLQAWVLNKLKHDARRTLGNFDKVVITVPAYFDEVRRKATQDAGYMAGLDVIDIINEPTAAALAFGYQRGQLLGEDNQAAKRVLVYDLGGGTFDVTIMEIGQGEFVTLATDGDVQLGGRDWDERLLDHVAEFYIRKHGADPREDASTYGRLLRDCEDAKRTLSLRHKALIPCDFRGYAERVEVSREKFEELTADLLERTAFTTRQALKSVNLEWPDIDRVLLVGGSTRMPAVVKLLRELSGQEPDMSVSPDEAVAHGAAIHAGLLLAKLHGQSPRIRVRNVNSHSLGIIATDTTTKRKQNAVLVPRNTPLPAKAKRIFRTAKDGQKSIVAQIVEGESGDPGECMQIGKCTVHNLPDDLPAGTPIEVRFQYEANGRVQVVVNVAGRQENVTHDLARENNLSPQDLEEWRRSIALAS